MPPRKSNASIASADPKVGDTSFDSNATLPLAQDATPTEKKTPQKESLGVEVGQKHRFIQYIPPQTAVQPSRTVSQPSSHVGLKSSNEQKSRIVTFSMSSDVSLRAEMIRLGVAHVDQIGPYGHRHLVGGTTVNPADLMYTATEALGNVKSTRELRIQEREEQLAISQVFGEQAVQERDVSEFGPSAVRYMYRELVLRPVLSFTLYIILLRLVDCYCLGLG